MTDNEIIEEACRLVRRRSLQAGEGRRERDATCQRTEHAAVYHRWQGERYPA